MLVYFCFAVSIYIGYVLFCDYLVLKYCYLGMNSQRFIAVISETASMCFNFSRVADNVSDVFTISVSSILTTIVSRLRGYQADALR